MTPKQQLLEYYYKGGRVYVKTPYQKMLDNLQKLSEDPNSYIGLEPTKDLNVQRAIINRTRDDD